MMNLHKYFSNAFNDKEISFTEILNYTAHHLAAMNANNPGALLNGRITATNVALVALESVVSDAGLRLAIQKAKTEGKVAFRDALPANIARIHAAVVAAFGPNAPEVTECFPEGRSVFNACRDEQLNNKLEILVAALVPKAAAVGQLHVNNAGGLLSAWTATHAAQGTAMATSGATDASRNAARAVLRLELFKNVLTLALNFPDDLAKADLYCPQQYLRNAQQPSPPDEASLSASLAPGTLTVTLQASAAGAATIRLERRMQGEADFSPIAAPTADANGAVTHADTLPGAGHFEYRATGVNGSGDGDASDVAAVQAP